MAGVIHDVHAIANFIGDGETRLVVAAYRDPSRQGELYYLEDNTAHSLREWTRAKLRCPFHDCPKPDLKAVARSGRRDGFSHLPGAHKHAPESIHHLQGKAVIAAWLRRLLGDDAVEVEAAIDTQRTRVADVLSKLPDGTRVAFEIQYASISDQEWRERHASYADQGILDIWLWGHTRLGRARRSAPTTFKLSQAQLAALDAGQPVLFLNPETKEVAIAYSDWDGQPSTPIGSFVEVEVVPLHHCSVDSNGLRSGWLDLMRQTAERRTQQLDEEAKATRELHVGVATMMAAHLERRIAQRDAALRALQERARRSSEQRREAARNRYLKEQREAVKNSIAAALLEPESFQGVNDLRWSYCRGCGEPLAEALQKQGYHVLCRPGRSTRTLSNGGWRR